LLLVSCPNISHVALGSDDFAIITQLQTIIRYSAVVKLHRQNVGSYWQVGSINPSAFGQKIVASSNTGESASIEMLKEPF